MPAPKITIIGELINNAYARARTAWEKRDLAGYQNLARLQAGKGAGAINVNVDGTQRLQVRIEEMLEFLPKLVPALQAATDVALSFDNPNLDYQRVAMAHFDRSKSRAKPIFNSLAASRPQLDEMIEFIRVHDMRCIVMASEKFTAGGGSETSYKAEECHDTVCQFVDLLASKAGRVTDDIIVDPGLAPVAADTYGIVNLGLDTMRLCRANPKLRGIHFSVGLSNFAYGLHKGVRHKLERAYLTVAGRAGLDYALANVELNAEPLPPEDPMVGELEAVLEAGRPLAGETLEDAGYRMTDKIMEICAAYPAP